MSAISSRSRNTANTSQDSRSPAVVKTKGRMPRAFKNKKVVIAGLVVALGIAYLIFSALQNSTMYYLTVSEVRTQGQVIYGQPLRVGGNVVDGTIDFNKNTRVLRFTMTDGQENMEVIFGGIVPDTFKTDSEVIVEGKFNGSVFQAETLLAKCPSKYIPGT